MKKFGFTLSEILIALGIIGIVAAITVPVLLQNSNSKKFSALFKKSMATLNQSVEMAHAQHDITYDLLTSESVTDNCATNSLGQGNLTMCGLFNSTLAGKTYLGTYGTVKGMKTDSIYTIENKVLNPEGFIIYSLSNGSFVGFNPNAKKCSIPLGVTVDNETINSTNLKDCLGFIDVNGPKPPNVEVTCEDADETVLNPFYTCKVPARSMGDVFPILFYNGVTEAASNASKAVLAGGGNAKKETPKTAAMLAAEKVTDAKSKDVLQHVDEQKDLALKMYQDSGYENVETDAYKLGLGNTAVYQVTVNSDGTYSITDTGKMNDAQIFHDNTNLTSYYIFVNGNTVTTNLQLKENADGSVSAYGAKYHLYVNKWHKDTVESMGFEI